MFSVGLEIDVEEGTINESKFIRANGFFGKERTNCVYTNTNPDIPRFACYF
jgi:hypothetical protein